MTWTSQMQRRPASPTSSPGHQGDLLKGRPVSAYHDLQALWQIAYGAKGPVSATSPTFEAHSTHETPMRHSTHEMRTQEIDVLGAILAPLDELFGHEKRSRKPSNPRTPKIALTPGRSSSNQSSGPHSPPAHSPLVVSSGNRGMWSTSVGGAALREEPAYVGAPSPGDMRGPALQLYTQNGIHNNAEIRYVQNKVVLFEQYSPSSTPANRSDGDFTLISEAKPKYVFYDADLTWPAKEVDWKSGNIDLFQQREQISSSPPLSLSQEHTLLSQNNTPVATGHSTPDSSQGTDAFCYDMGPRVTLFTAKSTEDEIVSLEQKIQDSERLLSTSSWKTTDTEFL